MYIFLSIHIFTNGYFRCEDRKYLTLKLLPKKASKTLRGTLQGLYDKIWAQEQPPSGDADINKQNKDSAEEDFQNQNKEVCNLTLNVNEK